MNGRWMWAAGIAVAAALAGCQTPEERAIEISHNLLMSGADKDVREERFDAAIRKLDRAAALKPDDARSHFKLGIVLVQRAAQPDVNQEALKQLVTRALEHHQTALKLAPKSPQAHYHVGRDYILLGQPAEAIAYLEIAQELDPKATFIDARLGDARRLMKQYDLALEHYQAGLKKPPERIATMELHEGLAETYAAMGRTDEAIKEFELARKSATSGVHLKRLEKRIEQLKESTAPRLPPGRSAAAGGRSLREVTE